MSDRPRRVAWGTPLGAYSPEGRATRAATRADALEAQRERETAAEKAARLETQRMRRAAETAAAERRDENAARMARERAREREDEQQRAEREVFAAAQARVGCARRR